MKPVTRSIPYTELQVGHIVHDHGARFEVYSVTMYPQDAAHIARYGVISPTMSAQSKWLDGAIVPGYFGPQKDWTLQGNALAMCSIEVEGEAE